jgi:hypothetical protein
LEIRGTHRRDAIGTREQLHHDFSSSSLGWLCSIANHALKRTHEPRILPLNIGET